MAVTKFWIEDIIKEIIERRKNKICLSSGKSISGSVHIGIFRELLICDSLKRMLEKMNKNVKFYFVVDDYDPAKHFPPYIPEEYKKYVGVPFSEIPSPDNKNESYAQYFAKELINAFKYFGIVPEIVWTSKLYETKEMKDIVRIVIDKIELVREILVKYIGSTLSEEDAEEYQKDMKERYPISVVCSKCNKMQIKEGGKILPNRILDYNKNKDTITYFCQSCKKKMETNLENAKLKLNWRVDWPAKWKILNVTCEPAGKDHAVKGGAYDTGLEICKRVFDCEGPVKVPYEWIRFGDIDMKTHKGIIFTPKQYLKIGTPEILRYILLRTAPSKHISFRPEFLPQYIDEYERLERIYFDKENNISEQEIYDAKILYPLTRINEVIDKIEPSLPFRFAVIFSQLKEIMDLANIKVKAEEVVMKIFNLTSTNEAIEKNIMETIKKAEAWVESYAPENYKIKITKEVDKEIKEGLDEKQRQVLKGLINLLEQKEFSEDELQNSIFELINNVKEIKIKKGFEAIYKVILGKKFGPRLGSFLMSLEKKWLIKRLKDAIN